MNYEQVTKDIKSGKFHPIYFLTGEETYYIDELTELIIEKAIPPHQKDFNQTILYGRDTSLDDVINLARRFPMFAENQLVVVKEAQLWKDFEKLTPYLENPTPSTILVICIMHKSLDKRKSETKVIQKNSVFLEFKKMKDHEIPTWIENKIKENGLKISSQSVELLFEYLGNNLSTIQNELEKIATNLQPGATVTPEVIEKLIGISKEYNVFEFSKAISEKNVSKAYKIADYFKHNPSAGPFVLILSTLYNLFSKLLIIAGNKGISDNDAAKLIGVSPYFFGEYRNAMRLYNIQQIVRNIHLLKEYDAKGKGLGNVSLKEPDLLKEMICKVTR